MSFRFTLFNACTLLVMALTAALAAWRLRAHAGGNWPLAGYAMLLGYSFGFPYSLNSYVVFAGLALALAGRIRPLPALRWLELLVLAYVLWRCLELLFGW